MKPKTTKIRLCIQPGRSVSGPSTYWYRSRAGTGFYASMFSVWQTIHCSATRRTMLYCRYITEEQLRSDTCISGRQFTTHCIEPFPVIRSVPVQIKPNCRISKSGRTRLNVSLQVSVSRGVVCNRQSHVEFFAELSGASLVHHIAIRRQTDAISSISTRAGRVTSLIQRFATYKM